MTTRWRRMLAVALLAAAAGLLLAGCAGDAASGRYTVTLITESEHVVGVDAPALGDLVVLGGTVTVEPGAELDGSIYLLGGDVQVAGQLDGTLTAFAGTARLMGTAQIAGDVVEAGGEVVREPGATVLGSIVQETNPASAIDAGVGLGMGAQVLWSAAAVLVMAGLAWLSSRAAPRSAGRVAAAGRYPIVAGALGALVLVAALPLLTAMVFTLFLIPVALVVLVVLGVAGAFGIIGIGRILGQWIARSRTWALSGAAATALGTAILTTGLLLVGRIPFVGFAVSAVTAMVAVGAVFLTGFGLRNYTPPADPDGFVDAGPTGSAGSSDSSEAPPA